MRNWEPKEHPKPPTSKDSVEADAPEAEGSFWEHYGPAVLAVVLVIVAATICNSMVSLR